MFPLQVLENEIFKFEENICDFEEDLNGGSNIPEDVRDTILTVIGMAKLLMAQKLTQFRELCYKNIVSRAWAGSEREICGETTNLGAGGKIQIPRSFDKLSTESFLARVTLADKEMSLYYLVQILCFKTSSFSHDRSMLDMGLLKFFFAKILQYWLHICININQ